MSESDEEYTHEEFLRDSLPDELLDSSNSSTIVPAVGNTECPTACTQNKKQCAPKSKWLITLKANNLPNSSIRSWIIEHTSYAVWQLEAGDETFYEHYQMSFNLKKKNRLTWLKNHFSRIAHCEVIQNEEGAFNYCQKSETRIGGPWYWPEPVRTVKDPLADKEYYDWQIDLINILKEEPDDRKIYWYWSMAGNTGKSKFTKHLFLKFDGVQVCQGKAADVYHSINTNLKILIVDIPRAKLEYIRHIYTILEEVKNGMIFSGKYESQTKVFDPPHVVVFANMPPDESQLSEDRWVIVNLD